MATDVTRLVDVRARSRDAAGRPADKVGSGTLVADDLVLTAAHVVFDGTTALLVRLQLSGQAQPVDGEVVWPRGAPAVDAALIRISTPMWQPPIHGRVRLGRFTGRAPNQDVDASGFPRVMYEG